MCDQNLGRIDAVLPHICNPQDVEKRINDLEEKVREAESKLNEIENAVYLAFQNLNSDLKQPQILVETQWLTQIWQSTMRETRSPEDYLARWIAMHQILNEAFDLFCPEHAQSKLLLEKLTDLKEACLHAQKIFKYNDSNISLTSEEVLAKARLNNT